MKARLAQAGIIAASLMLVVLVASLGLATLSVRQGWLHPPPFTVMLGRVELSAPCPAKGMDCDPQLPYYAIWRGDPQPDGSIHYRQLYFWYLNSPSRHP